MLDQDQLIVLLKQQVKEAGSQKTYALKHDLSEQYLSDVLNKRRPPGAKVLNALGYEAIEMYKKVYQLNDERTVQSQK